MPIAKHLGYPAIPKGKTLQAVSILGVAVIFGGGGSGAGVFNLIVQLTSLVVLALNFQAFSDFFRKAPRLPAVLVGAALSLPLMQSIPLPSFIWQGLPGRNMIVESMGLLNQPVGWFPISLNAHRTVVAFLSLIPPVTLIILTWDSSQQEKRQILYYIALFGIIVFLFGAQQLITGNRELVLFKKAFGSDDLQGTFANRNSAGLFFDIAICAIIGCLSKQRGTDMLRIFGSWATAVLLLFGVILTRSRSSMVLASVPIALVIFRAVTSKYRRNFIPRNAVALGLTCAALFVGAIVAANGNERLQASLSRFDDLQDIRPSIWTDALGSTSRYWPVGSGIGTFDEVFQIDESLENLRPKRTGRAHNDYIETTLESGAMGVALLLGWAFFLVQTAKGAISRRDIVSVTSVASLVLLAFQSILDYPLRSQTLLCMAGLMVALALQPAGNREVDKT